MSEGSVPFDHPWPEGLIREIGSVTVGGTPRTSIPDFWGGNIQWMASGDVHLKRIMGVPGRITERGLRSSNATLVSPPSVAVGLAGQGKTRGTVALVEAELCTNQSVALLKCDPDHLDIEYLFHNLGFRYEELRSRSAGGGRAGLSKGILEQISIPLPKLTEQRVIAEVLSTLDRAIEQTEALIAKQQRIKTGLMQDLLTKGIDEHGNIRFEATHAFKDSPLGRIPVEWSYGTFGELWAGGAQNGLYKPQSAYSDEGTPIVRIDGFRNGDLIECQTFRRVELNSMEQRSFSLKLGDLVVNRVNSIEWLGKAALVGKLPESTVFESNMMRIRVDQGRLVPEFAILILSSPRAYGHFLTCAKTAIAQASINQEDVRSLPIACPPLDEQVEIVRRVDTLHRLIVGFSSAAQKLEHLKAGLMHDLLTGKRRVTPLLAQATTQ